MNGFHLKKRRGVASKSQESTPRARKSSFFSRGRRSCGDTELQSRQSIDLDSSRETPSPQIESVQSLESFQSVTKEPSQIVTNRDRVPDDVRDSSPSNLKRRTDSDVRCSEQSKVEPNRTKQNTDDGNLCRRPPKLEISTDSDLSCSPTPSSPSNLLSKRSRMSNSHVRSKGLRRGLSSLSSKLAVLSTKGRELRVRSNISTEDLESARAVRSISPAEFHFHTSAYGGCNSSLTPIAQHYSTNEALLDLFSTLYEKDKYSRVTYAVGLQFIETALVTIPAHGYFKDDRYMEERTKSTADALAVTEMLGDIVPEGEDDRKVQLGILEGLVRQSFEAAVEDGEGEADKKNETSGQEDAPEGEDDREVQLGILEGPAQQSFVAAVEDCEGCGQDVEITSYFTSSVTAFLQDYANGTPHNFCVMPSQMGSLWSMTATAERHEIDGGNEVDTNGVEKTENTKVESAPTSTPSACPEKQVFNLDSECQSIVDSNVEADKQSGPQNSSEKQNDTIKQLLQREQPEDKPVATPSVKEEIEHQVAPAAEVESPSIVLAPTSDSSIQTVILKNQKLDVVRSTSAKSNVAALIDGVREQYKHLRRSGTFHVRFLDTYQGRLPGSTNGCTVIAPLTCIQYFTSPDQNLPGRRGGVSDELIDQVIDDESPWVLAAVRGKYNLGEGTFIVPSDVHDYLIEAGLLSCGQFVAVCGGDILNDEHLEQFKSSLLTLNGDRDARKVAATFFFHGHVVAVHVVKNQKGMCVDLIDSLPDPSNWITQSMRRRLRRAFASMANDDQREPTETEELDNDLPQNAVRIRCTDLEHFITLIRYYACTKFSEDEQKFIDTHHWEDNNCDFDCRVFQAFIWSEAV